MYGLLLLLARFRRAESGCDTLLCPPTSVAPKALAEAVSSDATIVMFDDYAPAPPVYSSAALWRAENASGIA